jgi:hypothetical protein
MASNIATVATLAVFKLCSRLLVKSRATINRPRALRPRRRPWVSGRLHGVETSESLIHQAPFDAEIVSISP